MAIAKIVKMRNCLLAQLRARPLLTVFIGVVCVSSGAIFIRLVAASGVTVAMYRMVFASLMLAPWTYRALQADRRLEPNPLTKENATYVLLAGLALAVHFATWISSLSYTSVAASVALVNTNALWTALFSWLFLGFSPALTVLLGAVLAVFGGALIGFDGSSIGSNPMLGNILALLGAVTVSIYLLLGLAAQRRGMSLQTYVGMVYAVAAVFLLPLPYFLGVSYLPPERIDWLWLVLLALLPQVVGHTAFNYAVKHVEPTTVTTMVLLEPVFSSLLAFIIFTEIPSNLTIIGGLILLAGVVLTAYNSRTVTIMD